MTEILASADRLLARPGVYDRLEGLGGRLQEGLEEAAREAGRAVRVTRVGSIATAFFTSGPAIDYASAQASDRRQFASFFHGMLEGGVYLPPSQFEAMFLSLAHTEDDLRLTIDAARRALKQ